MEIVGQLKKSELGTAIAIVVVYTQVVLRSVAISTGNYLAGSVVCALLQHRLLKISCFYASLNPNAYSQPSLPAVPQTVRPSHIAE